MASFDPSIGRKAHKHGCHSTRLALATTGLPPPLCWPSAGFGRSEHEGSKWSVTGTWTRVLLSALRGAARRVASALMPSAGAQRARPWPCGCWVSGVRRLNKCSFTLPRTLPWTTRNTSRPISLERCGFCKVFWVLCSRSAWSARALVCSSLQESVNQLGNPCGPRQVCVVSFGYIVPFDRLWVHRRVLVSSIEVLGTGGTRAESLRDSPRAAISLTQRARHRCAAHVRRMKCCVRSPRRKASFCRNGACELHPRRTLLEPASLRTTRLEGKTRSSDATPRSACWPRNSTAIYIDWSGQLNLIASA